MSTHTVQKPIGLREQLASGWHKQSSVMAALIIKDFKMRTSRGRFGMIFMILDPMMMLVMMASLWYLIGRTEIDGVSVVLYLSSGLILFSIIRQSLSSIPGSIKANAGLLNYPQVKPITCIVARFVFELFMLLMTACCLYFILWWVFGLVPKFNDPLLTIEVIAITMVFGLGISLILSVYATIYPTVGKIVSLFSRPLMFASCIIHSLQDLPATPRHYILYNPIVHLVERVRESLFGMHEFPGVNLAYPSMWAFCALGFGIVAYYANRFELIRE